MWSGVFKPSIHGLSGMNHWDKERVHLHVLNDFGNFNKPKCWRLMKTTVIPIPIQTLMERTLNGEAMGTGTDIGDGGGRRSDKGMDSTDWLDRWGVDAVKEKESTGGGSEDVKDYKQLWISRGRLADKAIWAATRIFLCTFNMLYVIMSYAVSSLSKTSHPVLYNLPSRPPPMSWWLVTMDRLGMLMRCSILVMVCELWLWLVEPTCSRWPLWRSLK